MDEAKMTQRMGYDRSITMFSPDGRLLQVEYAKKTVRQGSTALGIQCKDGVVLVADKRIVGKLVVPESVDKVFQIDDHIAATAAGIISDARVLVERAQVKAQQHRVSYDSGIDVLSVVKEMSDLCQFTTQSAGLRPFGVSLLVAGVDVDHEPRLFMTDPTGIFFRYRAAVIGEGEVEIEKVLQQKYKTTMTVEEGVQLGVRALMDIIGAELTPDRLEVVVITVKDKVYTRLSSDKLRDLLAKARKQ
ncbi:MAG TPA: archaeal proteasome endopeptidase complex subunit alpha [Candidatus Nanoarchaeia archaeon]|nr:archaeal proteasome endopeptidase complex subunit alpha [Candidatus Nanoarchaeia archaeon]